MNYEIFILRRAEKELRKISQSSQQKIREAIKNLSIEPRPAGCKKLKGRPAWRILVGVYRIIYEIIE